MRFLRISIPVTAILAALVLAGCGSSGSSDVTAAAYVKSICSAVAPFEKDVLTRSSALNLTAVKSPAQGKQALSSFLSAIATDTDGAVSKLQSAGTPKVSNGKQISSAILSAFSQLKTAMHKAASQSKALPTSTTKAFQTGATTLGNNVRTAMTSIGQNLQSSTLKSSELQKAAQKEPACKSIGS
jgi:hypothetical protein